MNGQTLGHGLFLDQPSKRPLAGHQIGQFGVHSNRLQARQARPRSAGSAGSAGGTLGEEVLNQCHGQKTSFGARDGHVMSLFLGVLDNHCRGSNEGQYGHGTKRAFIMAHVSCMHFCNSRSLETAISFTSVRSTSESFRKRQHDEALIQKMLALFVVRCAAVSILNMLNP